MDNKTQVSVALKLMSGVWQITKLNLDKDMLGTIRLPLSITAPVYNESRKCQAVWFKTNSRGTWFYKEVPDDYEPSIKRFA